MLSSAEAASRLRIDPRTLRKLVRSGALSAIEVGGNRALRISEADLDEYVKSHTVEAVAS